MMIHDDYEADDLTAFKFQIDVYTESFDDFEFLQSQIVDRAYGFVLKMEEHVMADELGDVIYDEEELRERFEEDEYVPLELIVEIHNDQYASDISALGGDVQRSSL